MKNLIALLLIITLIWSCSPEKKYTIIKEDKNEAIKKVNIDIQLNKEITEAELKDIALELKEERSEFEKLWIFYYLPGQEIGKGAWASTHFTPNLEVEILGSTGESIDEMNSIKVSGEILKVWFDDDNLMPNKIYLVKENDKLYIKTLYAKSSLSEASEIVNEVTEKKDGNLTRYDYENQHGEYYIIEKNGNIGMYGENGKFKEAVLEK